MVGKKGGLPDRVFVALAIVQQRNDAMPGSGDLGGVRHAAGYGRPMPERASGDFHASHLVGGVPTQVGTVLVMVANLSTFKKPLSAKAA